MGMFDFNPADVRVATSEGYTNAPMLGAFAGYGGMLQGIGKLAGFQDEEDLLKDIYDTSDFTTGEVPQDLTKSGTLKDIELKFIVSRSSSSPF